jgi:hypothetical protein
MTFTAIQIGPLGPQDPQYGQRYWGNVEETEMAVSFNLMQPVDILPGSKLEFEERTIKETGPNSKKPGTEYLFLKKVRVQGGQPLPQATSAPSTAGSDTTKLDAIHGDVKLILSFIRQMQKGDTPTKQLDTVVEDIGDGNITIDDLSGGHMTQEEIDSIPF